MQLSKYISDLLYRYDCVMVPNFGGFVSNTIASKVDPNTHVFSPPTKNISFNVNLKQNDGLLINHVAKLKAIPFDDAAILIQEKVAQWHLELEQNSLALSNLGLFTLENNTLTFEPANQTNFLASSFGLDTVEASYLLRNTTTTKVVPLPVNKKTKNSKTKYIAAAAVMAGLFIGNLYLNRVATQQEIIAQQEITTQIQQASFHVLQPLQPITLAITKSEAVKEKTFKYHIIAGAFKETANATKKVTLLTKKGYTPHIIGRNKWGLTQVSYASFQNKREAINALNKIRKTDNKHAWLFINK